MIDEKCSIKKYYAVKHKDDNIRANSRSGGVFTAISDYVFSLGGVVYGAKLNEDFTVSHKRAETKNNRNEFRGSKYVQSRLGNTFLSVEKDLNEDKTVLFSGTPCQVAGLVKFLKVNKTDTNKLFTLDIVCHGVPSEKVWIEYLNWIEKTHSKKIVKVDFRNKKDFGWADHIESVWFEDGSRFDGKYFRYLFYRHYILRPSCFKCKFKGNYLSDITIGDCWGIQNSHPEFNDNKGVSLVIPNTVKGEQVYNQIVKDIKVIEVKKDEVWQKPLFSSETPPSNREIFWKVFNKHSFKTVINKFSKDTFIVRVKIKLKKILKKLGVKL